MALTPKNIHNILSLALWGFFCLLPSPKLQAQIWNQEDTLFINYDSLLSEYLYFDSLLLDELTSDSASFMQLLDDLMGEKYIKSSFSTRIGYSGQITNAGRTIGINQYGFNAGVSYYHKSGFFADVSGYWNSDRVPNYNTTIIDVGYMGNFAPNWSYWASYSHYFYTKTEGDAINFPFTDAINASTNYYLKN